MKDELYINGRTFSAVRLAATHVSYSKDYITRLAREHKIRAVHIGRNWYVDVDALVQYQEVQTLELAARNRQLKLQRKMEHDLRDALAARTVHQPKVGVRFGVYAVAAVCFVLVFGFAAGAGLGHINQLAAVESAPEVAPVSAAAEAESAVLVPEFTTPRSGVVVSGDREIVKPATEKEWLRIRYE